jgi:3-oxoacyl-[acyl-carrier-protein] synthase-3
VGIPALAYQLPETVRTIEELDREGKLESPVAHLRDFGFDRVWIEESGDHMRLAHGAVARLLDETELDPGEVDVVIHSGSITPSGMIHPQPERSDPHFLAVRNFLDFFKFPASKLQYDFDMAGSSVLGIGQQSCTALISALRIARDIILAEDEVSTVLCVSSDAFPPNAKREVLYNVISDGGCAVLLRRGARENRLLSYAQITKGYYWDCDALKNEIIAAYFPTARTVIDQALERAGLAIEDIDWLMPHNVSARSWAILLGLLHFPRERFFGENIAAKGHSIASDNIVNLKDALDRGLVRKGQNVMLFNYGFGANWTCAILRA